jgi:hypothetical protein
VELDPLAVGLKFGFIAVLYLFLLWVARSAWRELKRSSAQAVQAGPRGDDLDQATAMHRAGFALDGPDLRDAQLVVESAPGMRAGQAWDLEHELVLGRSSAAHVVLDDSFSSSRHARLVPQGDAVVLEDLGSTNGTYLNGEPLAGPQPLHDGDRIRIGDSEFSFRR